MRRGEGIVMVIIRVEGESYLRHGAPARGDGRREGVADSAVGSCGEREEKSAKHGRAALLAQPLLPEPEPEPELGPLRRHLSRLQLCSRGWV